MEESLTPKLELGPITFDLTLVAMTAIIVCAVFLFIYLASRKMSLRPSGKQNVLEYGIDFVEGVVSENIGSDAKRYSIVFFLLFAFLLLANNLGLMTKLQTVKSYNLWTSPTANLGFDLSLSLLVTLFCHVEGIRRRGIGAYLKGFVTPIAMTPMNLLEEVTNFASLALRLYGNIFAGEVVMGLLVQLSHISPLVYPFSLLVNMIWVAFSIFISCIQAYVFVMLSSVYLGNKINGEE